MIHSQKQLVVQRLIAAVVVTFVVADTYPHPNLGPGLLESTFGIIEQNLVQSES